MGLRKLQRELSDAEQAVSEKRQQAGAFVETSKRRVKAWFGPWRIVAAGGLVGAVAGWRGSNASPGGDQVAAPAPKPRTDPQVESGDGFSAVIEQATSVVQLISLAAPLVAQYAPLLGANDAAAQVSAGAPAADGQGASEAEPLASAE